MSLTCETPSPLSRLSVPLWFFAFIPFKLGEALLITLLPLFIVQAANGSVADVGRVHSAISLAGVIAFILWGNLSDKIGRRRPFFILGFLGFGICTAFIALGQNVSQVFIFSFLGAFLMAAITPVASASILDGVPEEEWATRFGRFYQISGWSFVGGVLLGATWLALFSGQLGNSLAMRILLLFAGGVAFLSFILCLRWVREPQQLRKQRQYKEQLRTPLTVAVIERRALFYPSRMLYFVLQPSWPIKVVKQLLASPLLLYYGCAALFFFAVNLVFVPFPIFLTDVLGATNSQVMLISLGKAAIESFFYMPVGRFVQKRRGIHLQAWATGVRVVIFAIFTLVALMQPSPVCLIVIGVTHLLTGVTWAAINVSSTTVVAALAPKGQEGMAMGVYNSLLGVATIIGSICGGQLAQSFGYSACFATGAVLMGLTTMWLLSLQVVMPTQTSHSQSSL